MRSRSAMLVFAALIAVALTGCSTAAGTPESSPPTPDYRKLAGVAYALAVCPSADAEARYRSALESRDFASAQLGLELMTLRDTDAVKSLDLIWPEAAKDDVAIVRDRLSAKIPVERMASSLTTFDELNAVVWPERSAADAAQLRLQSELGISTHALTRC